MTKINQLQELLNTRLPHIKRWRKVTVSLWHDAPQWVKDAYPENNDMAYITWNGNKSRTNHHSYEIKEIPVSDIDDIIRRNKERLLNERKIYK